MNSPFSISDQRIKLLPCSTGLSLVLLANGTGWRTLTWVPDPEVSVAGAFSYLYFVAEIASCLSRIHSFFFLINSILILLVVKFPIKHYISQPPLQLGWPWDTVQANKVETEVVRLYLRKIFPKRKANSTSEHSSPVCIWPAFLACVWTCVTMNGALEDFY